MRGAAAIVFGLLGCALALGAAAQETRERWTQGAPLELRSGAGLGYRVLGRVAPGQRLDVLQDGDGWFRVRTGEGQEGWIVAEFLATSAPPRERVGQLEAETARLRAELSASTTESERLRRSAGELEGRDHERRIELDRLLRENARLSAGERWPDWIAGAAILAFGMLIGSLMRSYASGRRASRIRL